MQVERVTSQVSECVSDNEQPGSSSTSVNPRTPRQEGRTSHGLPGVQQRHVPYRWRPRDFRLGLHELPPSQLTHDQNSGSVSFMAPQTQYALSLLTIWSVPALVLVVVAARGRSETLGETLKRLDLPIWWWMSGGLFACGAWWAAGLYFGITVPLGVVAWVIGDRQLKRNAAARSASTRRPAKSVS